MTLGAHRSRGVTVHLVAIVTHAAFGVLALVLGVLALERTTRALGPYLVSLVGMLVALAVAFAGEWSGLDGGTQALFVVLGLLGVVVVGRGVEAVLVRPRTSGIPGRAGHYGRALGFTLVALVDAFLVIAVLDLGAPVWAVVGTAVVVAVLGHQGLLARLRVLDRAALTAR